MHVVHQLEEAKAAVQAGISEFITPPHSACMAGVGYWLSVQEAVRELFPEHGFTLWVCCGSDAAIAHDAMRVGLNIACEASEGMRAKLQAIADAQGVKMLDKPIG